MKEKENMKIHVEYGKENLKQLLIELLKEQYTNYITINQA